MVKSIRRKLDSVRNEVSAMSPLRIELAEKIFNFLYPVMNEIHGTNYSFRFWKLVLETYVNAVLSMKKAMEHSELIHDPSPEAINAHDIPSLQEKARIRAVEFARHILSRKNKRLIASLLATENSLLFGFPNVPATHELGRHVPTFYPLFGWGDASKRKLSRAIALQQEDLFHRNIINQLPKIYVEHFSKIFNSIVLAAPATKILHVHNLNSAYERMVVAKYAEAGAKLYWYQHGAYYGEFIGHNSHHYESSVADEYRTWGWTIKKNDTPHKAYRLEKFRIRYNQVTSSVRHDLALCFPDLSHMNIAFYKEASNFFFDNLSREKYPRIVARPRPLNKISSHAHRISFVKDRDVEIDSGLGEMAEIVAQSKMVIQFSVPSTNFLECLYVDKPSMGILENDQPTEQVKPFYEFLVNAGVLHYDFQSMVNHLNDIDVDTWWKEVSRHETYLLFKETFLRKV